MDPSFGEAGRVATAVDEVAPAWSGGGPGPTLRPESNGNDVHLATAPDGSLLVSRGNLLLRYLPDGQPDPSFGEAGRLAISTVEGLPFGLADIAIDGKGRILVFGTAVDPSISRFIYGYSIREVSPSFVTVLRLDPDGALDPSFGGGDGVFRTSLDLKPTPGVPADIPLVETESAEIDSAGRAVIAIGKVGFPPSIRSTPGWVGGALMRLTPSGTIDPSFGGGDGVVQAIVRDNGEAPVGDFCISSQDELIVALGQFTFPGAAGAEKHASGGLSRLHPDGTLDQAFGSNGIAQTQEGFGSLTCAGSHVFTLRGPSVFFPTREDPSLWRIVKRSADTGRVDRSFGGRARVKLRGRYSDLNSLAVDRHGRVLIAGTVRLPVRGKKGIRSFFAVVRLLPSGRLDQSFGRDGWARTSFGRGASISGGALAIDPAGHPVVVGRADASWLQPSGVVLARYLGGR